MSAPKHTPGPWYVDNEGNRILADDPRATIVCHLSASIKNPEVMADAHLIAAAPDMLEALEHLVEQVDDVALTKRARAAIKKARGEK